MKLPGVFQSINVFFFALARNVRKISPPSQFCTRGCPTTSTAHGFKMGCEGLAAPLGPRIEWNHSTGGHAAETAEPQQDSGQTGCHLVGRAGAVFDRFAWKLCMVTANMTDLAQLMCSGDLHPAERSAV